MNKTSSYLPWERFGDWTVISGQLINKSTQKSEHLCRCKCGTERMVRDNNLKTGISTNCGCRRRALIAERNKLRTGGVWIEHARAAHAWDRMVRRCTDPTAKGFQNYGGRGIIVCDRWMSAGGLENFISDMGDPPSGKTLGRRDNDSGYCPENCRWETNDEQQSNKRTNVYGYLNSIRMTAAQIGRAIGRHSSAVAKDIKKGMYANSGYLS